MLTHTQRLFMGSCRGDHAVNRISEFLDKSGKTLMALFSPEDTTETQDEGRIQIARHNVYNFNGFIKVVFWVAISISIALLIGRLS